MKRFSLFLLLLLSVNSVFCTSLTLNYDLFFGYMKTLYKAQYNEVTTAFYLLDKKTGSACLIKQAEIVVDQKREAIKFAQTGRLLPFFSQQHRKDGAMIEVELLAGQASYQCSLQVTLMAKESALDNLTWSRLALISEQLQSLLNKHAGMLGKYFLPTFSGLRLQLVEPLTPLQLSRLDKKIGVAKNGYLLVSNKVLKSTLSDKRIEFKLARITPWLTN